MAYVPDNRVTTQDIAVGGYYTLDGSTAQYLSGTEATKINVERRNTGLPRLTLLPSNGIDNDVRRDHFKSNWRNLRKEIGSFQLGELVAELLMESDPLPFNEADSESRTALCINDVSNVVFRKMIDSSHASPISFGVMKDFIRHRLDNKMGRDTIAEEMIEEIRKMMSERSQEKVICSRNRSLRSRYVVMSESETFGVEKNDLRILRALIHHRVNSRAVIRRTDLVILIRDLINSEEFIRNVGENGAKHLDVIFRKWSEKHVKNTEKSDVVSPIGHSEAGT